MTKEAFGEIEAVMLKGMQASVHDTGHIYRVLHSALRIAKTEPAANVDVVILAALLHDIGRVAEPENTGGSARAHRSHAEVGAEMAQGVLLKAGWDEGVAAHVAECIRTHSYKKGLPPESLEAKILFDADKLDLAGAVGCARAMLFGAEIGEPFYLVGQDGLPTPGAPEEGPSLFREYNRKLSKLSGRFFTKKGKEIAQKRQKTMDAYFDAMMKEVNSGYRKGAVLLGDALE